MKRFLIASFGLVLLAGCVSNKNLVAKESGTMFVYEPNARAAGGPKLPVKVAVLPFKDGTENFTTHGSVFAPDSLTLNLVKAGIPGTGTALTPELWAKSFTADMTTSGAFRAVRFVYTRSEIVDDDFFIEGTVERAYGTGSWDKPNEIALGFRAVRRADNRVVWEKGVTTGWIWRRPGACRHPSQCVRDQRYADVNDAIQALFAEARADLVATLASASGGWAGESGVPPVPGTVGMPSKPPAPESLEQTIDRILRSK